MISIIIFLVLFFLFQAFILFCCLAAADDPGSREISDAEQLEFLAEWSKKHKHSS